MQRRDLSRSREGGPSAEEPMVERARRRSPLATAQVKCSYKVLVAGNAIRNPLRTLHRAKSLRRPMTPQELGLWLRVKNRQLGGFKFRRQHPIGPYILDFYCAEVRLAVEIDGQAHWSPERERHDARRDAYLRGMGIETLRLSTESLKQPGAAADRILDVIRCRPS